jgi:cytochrome b subunit of formate dehydrogenase
MAFGLCKYKHIFGEPNAGIRKYRIFDIAIFDTVVVIVSGILISYFTGYKLWKTLAVLFISGIIVHRLFCVTTGVDRLLFQ